MGRSRRARARCWSTSRSSTSRCSSPGTYVMITEPGEKPSPRFCAVVSTCTPLMFVGSSLGEMLSRRPVAVSCAATVNASFGHGSRQWCPAGAVSSTSQPCTAASGIRSGRRPRGPAPRAGRTRRSRRRARGAEDRDCDHECPPNATRLRPCAMRMLPPEMPRPRDATPPSPRRLRDPDDRAAISVIPSGPRRAVAISLRRARRGRRETGDFSLSAGSFERIRMREAAAGRGTTARHVSARLALLTALASPAAVATSASAAAPGVPTAVHVSVSPDPRVDRHAGGVGVRRQRDNTDDGAHSLRSAADRPADAARHPAWAAMRPGGGTAQRRAHGVAGAEPELLVADREDRRGCAVRDRGRAHDPRRQVRGALPRRERQLPRRQRGAVVGDGHRRRGGSGSGRPRAAAAPSIVVAAVAPRHRDSRRGRRVRVRRD